jgi:hypothetical protein
MTVLWVVAPCCLVEVFRRFRGAFYLYHQEPQISLKVRSLNGI